MVESFTLLTLSFLIAAIASLAFIVHQNNPKNVTGRAFLFFSIVTILWGIANFLSSQELTPALLLWAIRGTIALAVWHALSLFLLVYVFPAERFQFPPWFGRFLVPYVSLVSILNLTPAVFSGAPQGVVTKGPGIVVFATTLVMLTIAIVWMSITKLIRARGETRQQAKLLLYGILITYALLIVFSFIFPTFLNDTRYVPYGAMFILPMIVFTTYAIMEYRLFSVKILTTQAFVIIISVVYAAKIIVADSSSERTIDLIIFVATILFGKLLINSVRVEIREREEIRDLAHRLEESNWELAQKNEKLLELDKKKSEFVSIASHQLRTPITAIKGYASMLLEDAFGKLKAEQFVPVEKILMSSERLVAMVADFLDVSKIEQGTMTYNIAPVDIALMLSDLTEEFGKAAERKELMLRFTPPAEGKFIATVDAGKVRQIFSNLIDNSIKYTPQGGITITITADSARGKLVVRITDTGIGLSHDDIVNLFGKFARGSEGRRQNTDGSGLGLYVAKEMLEAQGGNVFADSEGPGKGSTFVIELPMGQ